MYVTTNQEMLTVKAFRQPLPPTKPKQAKQFPQGLISFISPTCTLEDKNK